MMAALREPHEAWDPPNGSMTQAVIEHIEDGVATVLVGDELAEWDFPVNLLPGEAAVGSVLLLEANGRDYEVIGLGARRPSVEDRLDRRLSRRRPIVLPLPQRHSRHPAPEISADNRPSRLFRSLGR